MVLATFTKKEIENTKDDDRKGIGSQLRSYLKNKIGSKNSIEVLFRVKKMDLEGRITFIPHDIAKELSKNDTYWSTRSIDKLKSHKLRKVIISPAGKIKDA